MSKSPSDLREAVGRMAGIKSCSSPFFSPDGDPSSLTAFQVVEVVVRRPGDQGAFRVILRKSRADSKPIMPKTATMPKTC